MSGTIKRFWGKIEGNVYFWAISTCVILMISLIKILIHWFIGAPFLQVIGALFAVGIVATVVSTLISTYFRSDSKSKSALILPAKYDSKRSIRHQAIVGSAICLCLIVILFFAFKWCGWLGTNFKLALTDAQFSELTLPGGKKLTLSLLMVNIFNEGNPSRASNWHLRFRRPNGSLVQCYRSNINTNWWFMGKKFGNEPQMQQFVSITNQVISAWLAFIMDLQTNSDYTKWTALLSVEDENGTRFSINQLLGDLGPAVHLGVAEPSLIQTSTLRIVDVQARSFPKPVIDFRISNDGDNEVSINRILFKVLKICDNPSGVGKLNPSDTGDIFLSKETQPGDLLIATVAVAIAPHQVDRFTINPMWRGERLNVGRDFLIVPALKTSGGFLPGDAFRIHIPQDFSKQQPANYPPPWTDLMKFSWLATNVDWKADDDRAFRTIEFPKENP